MDAIHHHRYDRHDHALDHDRHHRVHHDHARYDHDHHHHDHHHLIEEIVHVVVHSCDFHIDVAVDDDAGVDDSGVVDFVGDGIVLDEGVGYLNLNLDFGCCRWGSLGSFVSVALRLAHPLLY